MCKQGGVSPWSPSRSLSLSLLTIIRPGASWWPHGCGGHGWVGAICRGNVLTTLIDRKSIESEDLEWFSHLQDSHCNWIFHRNKLTKTYSFHPIGLHFYASSLLHHDLQALHQKVKFFTIEFFLSTILFVYHLYLVKEWGQGCKLASWWIPVIECSQKYIFAHLPPKKYAPLFNLLAACHWCKKSKYNDSSLMMRISKASNHNKRK